MLRALPRQIGTLGASSGTKPFPAEHGRGEPGGRRALGWDAQCPPHTRTRGPSACTLWRGPIGGSGRAWGGQPLFVSSWVFAALPALRFPRRCPRRHGYLRIFLLLLVNSLQAVRFRPKILGVATPQGNVARAAPPPQARGCGNWPRAPAQGAVLLHCPCEEPDLLRAEGWALGRGDLGEKTLARTVGAARWLAGALGHLPLASSLAPLEAMPGARLPQAALPQPWATLPPGGHQRGGLHLVLRLFAAWGCVSAD